MYGDSIRELIYIIDFPIFFILMIIFIRLTVIIHESLHKYVLKWYNIPIQLTIDKFFSYAISIDDKDLTYKEFLAVATAPYYYLIPFFIGVMVVGNEITYMFGLVGLIHHLLNLPLEFDGVDKNGFKKEEQKSKLQRAVNS